MSEFTNWGNWRWEKSASIATSICYFLAHSQKIPHGNPYKGQEHDLRSSLYPALNNALKILCQEIEEHYFKQGSPQSNRWSPELTSYLFSHPEKCEETLKIVESDDYRDGYYDKVKS